MFNNYDSKKTSERVERKSKDKEFILDVVNKTTEYTGKRLLANEIEGLIKYIQEVDYRLFANKPRKTIVDQLARNFTAQIRVTSGTMVDSHEMMKQQIGTIRTNDGESLYQNLKYPQYNPVYGIKQDQVESYGNYGDKALNTEESEQSYLTNSITRQSTIPTQNKAQQPIYISQTPSILENAGTPYSSLTDKYPRIAKQPVQNVYLLLDSKYRDLTTDPSVYRWTVLHSANTTQGTVNTLSDQIHNITNIQFDRFNLPYVGSADNVYKKVSVFVEEFSSMSVLIHSGRYHMIFDSEIIGNQIQLTPLVNDEGRFRFHTPVNVLNTLTLSFRSPFSRIEFLPDRYNVTITSLTSTQSILNFTQNHGVADGELVHLEGFTTDNPSVDFTQIALINREQGHIVTFINNTQLRIDIDLSTVTLNPNVLVDCFIATRRLIIPVRMEYLIQT